METADATSAKPQPATLRPQAAPAADGFNAAASNIDLDKDITVRPIRLRAAPVVAG